jgi:hypothetical protein
MKGRKLRRIKTAIRGTRKGRSQEAEEIESSLGQGSF